MNAIILPEDAAKARLWRRAKDLRHVPSRSGVIAGIDPSLTATGIALIEHGRLLAFSMSPPKGCRGKERLFWFFNSLRTLVRTYEVKMVGLEGYAYGSKFSREQLGELGGVLKLALHTESVPYLVIPPSSLKAFATGKGNADKETVGKELYKRWAVDLDSNDATDAAGLALIAFQRLHCGLQLTQVQMTAVAKATHE